MEGAPGNQEPFSSLLVTILWISAPGTYVPFSMSSTASCTSLPGYHAPVSLDSSTISSSRFPGTYVPSLTSEAASMSNLPCTEQRPPV